MILIVLWKFSKNIIRTLQLVNCSILTIHTVKYVKLSLFNIRSSNIKNELLRKNIICIKMVYAYKMKQFINCYGGAPCGRISVTYFEITVRMNRWNCRWLFSLKCIFFHGSWNNDFPLNLYLMSYLMGVAIFSKQHLKRSKVWIC